jgi:hypothetical protein
LFHTVVWKYHFQSFGCAIIGLMKEVKVEKFNSLAGNRRR